MFSYIKKVYKLAGHCWKFLVCSVEELDVFIGLTAFIEFNLFIVFSTGLLLVLSKNY